MTMRMQSNKGGFGDFPFTDSDFEIIADIAYRNFGLHLPSSKKSLVYSRLARRVRKLDLKCFTAYCALLEGDQSKTERAELLSALTTNVTHFFREEHHFELLREKILPKLISSARCGSRIRIWSAGCSAGQEPYSIAFTLWDMCPDIRNLDIRIFATDIDPAILNHAEKAVYSEEDTKSIPEPLKRKYLISGKEPGTLAIKPEIRQIVSFQELNLIDSWPVQGPFDVIFCRNVAIYFDKPTQATLWKRFSSYMTKDGHLFIGHSERLSGPASELFKSAGVTAYQRQATN